MEREKAKDYIYWTAPPGIYIKALCRLIYILKREELRIYSIPTNSST